MADRSAAAAGAILVAAASGHAVARLKRLARFLLWQWRAARLRSSVRSADVALGAGVGRHVIIERGVFVDAASRIGDYSYCNPNGSVENAVIGKFCSIARDVMIGPANHDYRKVSTHPFWQQRFYGFDCGAPGPGPAAAPTRIGDDVWIGCGAVVMQGVAIGTGAVLGAGAIVTKSVGPYEIWAGVPAKKIGQRFDDDVIAALLATGWSDWHADRIQARVLPHIANVQAVIDGALTDTSRQE